MATKEKVTVDILMAHQFQRQCANAANPNHNSLEEGGMSMTVDEAAVKYCEALDILREILTCKEYVNKEKTLIEMIKNDL